MLGDQKRAALGDRLVELGAIGREPSDPGALGQLIAERLAGVVEQGGQVQRPGIVDPEVWQRVQQVLSRNGRNGGVLVRNRYGALLKGLLYCVPCGCAMSHTYSSKRGKVKYRYYTCLNAQKRGWHTCPSKSVPVEETERLVVEQIRALGCDPGLITATLRHARRQAEESMATLAKERATLQRQRQRFGTEVRSLALDASAGSATGLARLTDLHERINQAEQRAAEVDAEITALQGTLVTETEVREALQAFDPLWEALSPKERARILRLLIKRVEYDGAAGTLSVLFHPGGIRELTNLAREEVAA